MARAIPRRWADGEFAFPSVILTLLSPPLGYVSMVLFFVGLPRVRTPERLPTIFAGVWSFL